MPEKVKAPQTDDAQQEKEQSGGVATLEKPTKFEDDDLVTVINGWGRLQPGERHFVDKILFVDGVARNVPYAIAKYWVKGTRPDGKHDQVHGKVKVHIFANDATEADFAKATGITPMPVDKFASMLAGVDLDALATQLGAERLKQLVAGLEKHLPAEPRRR